MVKDLAKSHLSKRRGAVGESIQPFCHSGLTKYNDLKPDFGTKYGIVMRDNNVAEHMICGLFVSEKNLIMIVINS